MAVYSYPKHKINVLLFEKIHPVAVESLRQEGFTVKELPDAPEEGQLIELAEDVHVIGIRSKTRIPASCFDKGRRLLAVGCFCVGTNNVDLSAATSRGVPVFNAPYANTRSVAELTLGNIIMLSRRAAHQNRLMHAGRWEKSARSSYEVRGKVLGIIGYGHIGQQVALLAESCGLKVIFYDILKKLSLGTARPCSSQEELLASADFVSLHIPALPDNEVLIGQRQLSQMKRGSYLLNLARGSLVDLEALRSSLESGHLSGAALDVLPEEPASNSADFTPPLAGMENVILTPHVAGSTQEAQYNIGFELSSAIREYINHGTTSGAVNFPQINAPLIPEAHRILNVHRNVPGVLSEVNKIVSDIGANIEAQYLSTYQEIGYLVMDINKQLSDEVKRRIAGLETSIKTRILY